MFVCQIIGPAGEASVPTPVSIKIKLPYTHSHIFGQILNWCLNFRKFAVMECGVLIFTDSR